MGNVENLNEFTQTKQTTEADKKRGRPITEKDSGVVLSGNSIITLPFFVAQDNKTNFLLFLAGVLKIDGTDYNFTSITPANVSNEVTLTSPVGGDTNYVAILIGIEKALIPNASSLQANITSLQNEVLEVGQTYRSGFKDFIEKPLSIAVPDTEIINRKSIIDLSNDLLSRQAVNRIHVQRIKLIENEFGPSNEPVFSIVNDKFDQIRVVGNWISQNDSSGIKVTSNLDDDFLEITFYGTGLSYMTTTFGTNDIRATIDGGVEGGDITPNISSILDNRNYSSNVLINITKGLSLGLHTIKLRRVSGNMSISGFEILNESSNLITNPGNSFINTTKVSLGLQDSQSYNSTFESGTLAAKGGQVLVYLKSDGTVKKSVTPTEASQLNLGSADHTNEEIVRKINFREFGSGRSDDFSTLDSTLADKLFTLEDGSVGLVGSNVQADILSSNNRDELHISASTDFYILTFIGTGLDFFGEIKNTVSTGYDVIVDGANIGDLSISILSKEKIFPIVSGLPYGTHTCKILRDATADDDFFLFDFIIYQPKKPTLPSNSIELSSYNIMADFVANSVAGLDTISTGTLRKSSSREFIYTNGTGGTSDWGFSGSNDPTKVGHIALVSDRLNAIFQYTFFGTGFDLRFSAQSNRATAVTITLNGTTLTAANFPTASFNTYGTGVSFNSTTGVLDQQDGSTTNGSGFVVSGLTLDTYIVKFDNGVTTEFISIDVLDIITPIHSYKSNLPFNLQNTLLMGNHGILDLRKFSPLKREIVKLGSAKAKKIGNSNTTSNVFIPLPEMQVVIKTNGNPVEINATLISFNDTVASSITYIIVVDGIQIPELETPQSFDTLNSSDVTSILGIIELNPGTHLIQIFWKVSASSTGTNNSRAVLNVIETNNKQLTTDI